MSNLRKTWRRMGKSILFDDRIDVFTDADAKLVEDCRGENDFNFLINCGGGNVIHALKLHAEFCGRVRKATIIEQCSSSAILLAMAADRIEAERTASFLLHPFRAGVYGAREDFLFQAENLQEITGISVEIIAARTKHQPSTVREWMSKETRFTAEEALKSGLIDFIIEPSSDLISVPQERKESNDIERVLTALRCLGGVRCDKFELMAELRAWVGTVQHSPASVFSPEAGSLSKI